MALPYIGTDAIQMHADEISTMVARMGRTPCLLLDRAGWHTTGMLTAPKNVTLVFLPPGSPELNPVEQIWQYLRSNWLSNRLCETHADIVDEPAPGVAGSVYVSEVITRSEFASGRTSVRDEGQWYDGDLCAAGPWY